MPKVLSVVSHRWLLPLCVVLLMPACKPVEKPPAESATVEVSPTEAPPQEIGPKQKVMVVEVLLGADGTIQPIPKVKIKKNRDIVIWVTDGESMNITWKPSSPPPGNPFTNFVCGGSFCGSLTPSNVNVAPGEKVVYYYTVTVDGKSLDPDVEVEG